MLQGYGLTESTAIGASTDSAEESRCYAARLMRAVLADGALRRFLCSVDGLWAALAIRASTALVGDHDSPRSCS